jgi:hypothetical protein
MHSFFMRLDRLLDFPDFLDFLDFPDFRYFDLLIRLRPPARACLYSKNRGKHPPCANIN